MDSNAGRCQPLVAAACQHENCRGRGELRIEGAGSERARIAYASEQDGRLVFTFQSESPVERNAAIPQNTPEPYIFDVKSAPLHVGIS